MKMSRKITIPLLVPLALSVILHLFFIAGITSRGGFILPAPLSTTILLTRFVTDRSDVDKADKETSLSAPAEAIAPTSKSGELLSEEKDTGPSLEQQEPRLTGEESRPAPDDSLAPAGEHALGEQSSRTEPAEAETQPQSPEKAAEPPLAERQKAVTYNPFMKTVLHERLSFDIYWMGIYVGKAVIEATNENETIRITSRVNSAPFISTFYKVEDFYESTLINGLPVNFRIKQHEGKHRGDKETVFDNANRKITFFNYVKGTKDEHTVALPRIWDLMSGFYYLRAHQLTAGEMVSIDVFDSNKFSKVEVAVFGKEKITLTELGEVEAIKVKPVITTEGLFKKTGDIFIWLTADDRKIPVKVETKVPIGTVVAELKSIK